MKTSKENVEGKAVCNTNALMVVNNHDAEIQKYKSMVNGLLSESLQDIKEKLDSYESKKQKIEEMTVPLKRNSHLFGLFHSTDVEGSFDAVYTHFKDISRAILDAINERDKHFRNLYIMINLLAKVDEDIYQKIDYANIDNGETRQIFIDFCKEHGIHDEEVEKLFDISFKRAHTLRDRIEGIRQDMDSYDQRITAFEDKYEKFYSQMEEAEKDFQHELDEKVNAAELVLDGKVKSYESRMRLFEQETEKKTNALTMDVDKAIIKAGHDVQESIQEEKMLFAAFERRVNEQLDNDKEQIEELRKILIDFKSRINAQLKNANNQLAEQKLIIRNLKKRTWTLEVVSVLLSLIALAVAIL